MQPPPAKKTKKAESTRPARSIRVVQQQNPKDSKVRDRGDQEENAADTTNQCVICSKKFEAAWCHFPGGSGQIPIKTLKENFLRLFSTWKSLNEPSESDHAASQNFLAENFPFCPFCITMVNDLCRREEQLEISMRHFIKARDEVLRQSIQGHKVSGGSKHPHFLIQRRILMGALESDHRPVADLLEEHMAKICGETTGAGSKLDLEGHMQDQPENIAVVESEIVGQSEVADLGQENLVKKAKDTRKEEKILRSRVQEPCDSDSDSAEDITEVEASDQQRSEGDLLDDDKKEMYEESKEIAENENTSEDYVEEQWDEGSAEDYNEGEMYDDEEYEDEEYEDTASYPNEIGDHSEDQSEIDSVVDKIEKVEIEASSRSSEAYFVNAKIANACEQSARNGYESEDLQQSDSTVRSAEDDEGNLEDFKWGQTIRSLLSSQPDNSMPIRHLRREVVALYYAFPGNVDRSKTKDEIGYKLMKKLMKKGFQIIDDKVILKD